MWKSKKYTINFALMTSKDVGEGIFQINAEPIIRKEKLEVKPSVGEIIYFDDKLPYYKVESVYHNISKQQHVWVYLSKIEINE